MGQKAKMNIFRKGEAKKAEEEKMARAKRFLKKYRTIRKEEHYGFEGVLRFGEGGITPSLRISDLTGRLKPIEAMEKKAEALEAEREGRK